MIDFIICLIIRKFECTKVSAVLRLHFGDSCKTVAHMIGLVGIFQAVDMYLDLSKSGIPSPSGVGGLRLSSFFSPVFVLDNPHCN